MCERLCTTSLSLWQNNGDFNHILTGPGAYFLNNRAFSFCLEMEVAFILPESVVKKIKYSVRLLLITHKVA